jgi:chromosome segregation ATPase
MGRRSWFGYQSGAVAAARQAEQERFEAELALIEHEEAAIQERLAHLRRAEEQLAAELHHLERAEESVRTALTGAIDREAAALQSLADSHEQGQAEAATRIDALKQKRLRIERVEAALLESLRSALATHVLQEEELS